MMIPPLVRVGYPTDPKPGELFALLVMGKGWVIGRHSPVAGWVTYKDELIGWTNILCWMPQDGS